MSFRAALRYANRSLQLIALLSVAALAAITAIAVFGGDHADEATATFASLEREARSFDGRRPLRQPIGDPLPGDAMDDYHWRCGHRHPRPRPTSLARLAELSPEQRAAFDDPIERAVIDRFVRGQRREDVGPAQVPFDCDVSMMTRSSAVVAAAVIAADRGELELAWRRAVAVVRYADDVLGRAPLILAMASNASATRAVALMAELADRGSAEQTSRWRAELARLRTSALDPETLDAAFAVGEAFIEPYFLTNADWRAELLRYYGAMLAIATGEISDIDVWCEKVGADRAYCDMSRAARRDVTVVAAGLEAVACKLTPAGDPRCEGLASRL